MKNLLFDLKTPENSYFIGFIQADGHLQSATRNRGRLSIEINSKDKDILEKFISIIPVKCTVSTRLRVTNFSMSSQTITLNVFDLSFRSLINLYGVPYGKKSRIIKPPTIIYSEHDYWRGILDADGSLGITSTGIPFISLVTASEELYQSYKLYLYKYFNIEINLNRNKRDNVYNIMITKEKCQNIVSTIYYKNCFSMERKKQNALKTLLWVRQ